MNRIAQILNVSEDQYQAMLFETYIEWCSDFVINYKKDLQCLVANSALNGYFLYQYGKLELEFMELISGYTITPGITDKDMMMLYSDCTFKIFNRFSKILVEKAKKTNIYNYDSNRN